MLNERDDASHQSADEKEPRHVLAHQDLHHGVVEGFKKAAAVNHQETHERGEDERFENALRPEDIDDQEERGDERQQTERSRIFRQIVPEDADDDGDDSSDEECAAHS